MVSIELRRRMLAFPAAAFVTLVLAPVLPAQGMPGGISSTCMADALQAALDLQGLSTTDLQALGANGTVKSTLQTLGGNVQAGDIVINSTPGGWDGEMASISLAHSKIADVDYFLVQIYEENLSTVHPSFVQKATNGGCGIYVQTVLELLMQHEIMHLQCTSRGVDDDGEPVFEPPIPPSANGSDFLSCDHIAMFQSQAGEICTRAGSLAACIAKVEKVLDGTGEPPSAMDCPEGSLDDVDWGDMEDVEGLLDELKERKSALCEHHVDIKKIFDDLGQNANDAALECVCLPDLALPSTCAVAVSPPVAEGETAHDCDEPAPSPMESPVVAGCSNCP